MVHTALTQQVLSRGPGASAPRSITIIGGGFAGAALAYHLLQRQSPLRINIVERGEQLGRGLAYAVQNPVLRLNVPAARMSLDPERPDDFVQFAGCEATPHAFLPRREYGAYVEARLTRAMRARAQRLQVVRGEAIAIESGRVRLRDGRSIAADRIVLATGVAAASGSSRWPEDARVIDAWDEVACTRAAGHGRLLLVGAGLSSLDALTLLESAGHSDEVTVLSRHGLLPRPHAASSGSFQVPASHGPAPTRLRALVRWVRALVQAAEHSGAPWQHAIDALRPDVPRLWEQLSTRDRERFACLVRPYWEVLRHRAPADTLEAVAARRAHGQLRLLSGRVLGCQARADGLHVTLRLRGGACRVERFSRVVRCLGPAPTIEPESAPLLAALLRAGLAQRDPTGLGIVTLAHGRLTDSAGRPSRQLFAIGQPCRASRWETTSVPEIVRDAVALAELFTSEALSVTKDIT
jgi:uncharacterized NAD(P)/FAD-binding protein YdhS